jgi:hypothetical protein
MTEAAAMDTEIARIARAQDDARQFCEGTRSATPAIWPVVVAAMVVGAAIFGGGMAVGRLL